MSSNTQIVVSTVSRCANGVDWKDYNLDYDFDLSTPKESYYKLIKAFREKVSVLFDLSDDFIDRMIKESIKEVEGLTEYSTDNNKRCQVVMRLDKDVYDSIGLSGGDWRLFERPDEAQKVFLIDMDINKYSLKAEYYIFNNDGGKTVIKNELPFKSDLRETCNKLQELIEKESGYSLPSFYDLLHFDPNENRWYFQTEKQQCLHIFYKLPEEISSKLLKSLSHSEYFGVVWNCHEEPRPRDCRR